MLVIHRRIPAQDHCAAELELSFDARSKSRLRCFTRQGEEVGLFALAQSLERPAPACWRVSG